MIPREIIKQALSFAGIGSAEFSVTADEIQDAARSLESIIVRRADSGVAEFANVTTPFADLDADIPEVTPKFHDALARELAGLIASDFGLAATPGQRFAAARAISAAYSGSVLENSSRSGSNLTGVTMASAEP